ncbi:hypothetical protein RSK20926_11529 [Roseobacter sp. SK209-2-6]|nr:hypothetical protein RSK20926_11529 [Roseobacter sp. SK209-2-6]
MTHSGFPNSIPDTYVQDPHAALAQVLARFGLRRTLTALASQWIASRRLTSKTGRPPPLNNHLRRDIGLLPLPEDLPSSRMHF